MNEAAGRNRDSPNKRVLNKNSTKPRAHEEEWYRKLESNTRGDFEEEDELAQNGTSGLARATRGKSSTRKKKQKPDQIGKEFYKNFQTIKNSINS